MLVSIKWLCSLVPALTATSGELAEKMSTSGIEVEGVTSPAKGLSGLVVGEVLACEDIPETHLHLCRVDAAGPETLQIVCGAPNVRAGIKVIVALVGARIADNHKIKKGKMRGFESQGMICSLQELGVPEHVVPKEFHDGIYIFVSSAENGASALSLLDLDDDILDLDVLANRADALSMRGVAYEVGAIYDLPVQFDSKNLTESDLKASDKISVKVEADKGKVPTYKLRIIDKVTVAPSPAWLQNCLMNEGIRPINNVVDVTNYVLLYFGQPLHSFDYARLTQQTDNTATKLEKPEILVRQAHSGEKLTTLDDVERLLEPSDIVITANGRPVALGGVMGGANTEITAETTTVALEAALFEPTSIRKTAQKFALRSEASARFEKGVNQGTVQAALDYAAAMIAELAHGEVLSGTVESSDYLPKPVHVAITLARINAVLGTELTTADVTKIFEQLGFDVNEPTAASFEVIIPSRRWDITIEADLIEEVARIYGYDKLPSTLPETGVSLGELKPEQKLRRQIRTKLEAAGLSEVVAYSLTTHEKAVQFNEYVAHTTRLMLPMTEERTTLRENMISGLLDIVNYNQNRKLADVAIYEIGHVFFRMGENPEPRPVEIPALGLAISGNVADKTYSQKAVPVDFYYAKGIVEMLLAGYEKLHFEPYDKVKELHPGRTAAVYLADRQIGFVGQVHPAIAKVYDIAETYVATLDLSALLGNQPSQPIFAEIPKFPAVNRDVAFLVADTVTHAEVLRVIEEAKVRTLVKTDLFDVYQGEAIEAGKKSMAYSLTFQNTENTMTDEEIAAAVAKISGKLTEKLGAEIR